MQSDLVIVHEQRLAITRAVDEARNLIVVLKTDKAHLQAEVDEMHRVLLCKVLHDYKAEPVTAKVGKLNLLKTETLEKEVDSVKSTSEPHHLPTKRDWDAELGKEDNLMQATTVNFKHPKGFKELRFRVLSYMEIPKK